MALRIVPPDGLEQLWQRVLNTLGQRFGPHPMLTQPYPVETVALETLASGRLQGAGGEARWQCLAGAVEPEAAIDVVRVTGEFMVVSVNYGRLAAHINDAVALAHDATGPHDYELRALEVPGLHFAALELVATDERLFVPVEPLDTGATRIYSAEELAATLQPQAERTLDEWSQ
jgi:hypothetical protein